MAESGLVTAVSAGAAGAIAVVITTPVDVAKTRIMLAAAENAASEARAGKLEKRGSGGLVDAFGKTVRSGKEGVASAATALNPLASSGKKGGRAQSRSGVRSLLKRALRGCGGAAH